MPVFTKLSQIVGDAARGDKHKSFRPVSVGPLGRRRKCGRPITVLGKRTSKKSFQEKAAWSGISVVAFANALAYVTAMTDPEAPKVRNLTPDEVARGISEGRVLLVDVREPHEIAAEAYPDAVNVPLSTFDPKLIPDPQGREVVFACRSGRRSVTASQAAQAQGLPYDAHLAGGILAWKAAGHPTES